MNPKDLRSLLSSPLARVAAAILVSAGLAVIAYVLQSQEIQRCIEAGGPRSECATRHRDLVVVLGTGILVFVLMLTPRFLTPRMRDRLQQAIERVPGFRAVIPEEDEDRQKLIWASRIGVPASVALVLSLVLWLATGEAGGVWNQTFLVVTIISAAAWGASFVYAAVIRRRVDS